MSTRRADESRPGDNATPPPTTMRDVPLAKLNEASVGTSPPGALRGPSLLPGQGAPERIVSEEIELAVLRDAVTLDGPKVARVAARRQPEPSASPPPVPVSVEVPRARSAPPLDDRLSTPPSPSARSIQSGTLMSVGSIDPRAPTERSLHSPPPLSVSERAAYFGPESVVDRSPAPSSAAYSSPAGVTPSAPVTADRESVPPPAQHFTRERRVNAVRPRAPESPAPRASFSDEAPAGASPRASTPSPSAPVGPRYQVHSEITALKQSPSDDNFDLRRAHTLREPLASRRAEVPNEPLDAAVLSEKTAVPSRSQASRSSTAAITLRVDRGSTESSSTTAPNRRAARIRWAIMAVLALLVALILVWASRLPTALDTAHVPDGRASASAPSAGPSIVPSAPPDAAPKAASAHPAVPEPALPSPRPGSTKSSLKSGFRSTDTAAHDSEPSPSAAKPEASSKSRQSIY